MGTREALKRAYIRSIWSGRDGDTVIANDGRQKWTRLADVYAPFLVLAPKDGDPKQLSMVTLPVATAKTDEDRRLARAANLCAFLAAEKLQEEAGQHVMEAQRTGERETIFLEPSEFETAEMPFDLAEKELISSHRDRFDQLLAEELENACTEYILQADSSLDIRFDDGQISFQVHETDADDQADSLYEKYREMWS